MKISKSLLGLLLAAAAQIAAAIPVSGIGDSGVRGAAVSATLQDAAASGVDSLQFSLSFDTTYLTFVGTVTGSLVAFDTIFDDTGDIANGNVLVAMASSDLPVDSGAGSLAELLFTINAGAPLGDTDVVVTCLGASTTDDAGQTVDLGCVDYAFGSVTATITVLPDRIDLPLPATLPLVLLGLAGIALRRKRES